MNKRPFAHQKNTILAPHDIPPPPEKNPGALVHFLLEKNLFWQPMYEKIICI